ncbi:MAG: argininosuccinate lyase [Candidatus Micrarchaeota archaeon]
MAKLWNKGSDVNKEVEKYLFSDLWADQQLVKYECLASIAHAKMLSKIGILNDSELTKLVFTLQGIIQLDEQNQFVLSLQDEDVHTKVENHLVQKLGELGKKIHTYRSRNDQLLVNSRLYNKEKIGEVKSELVNLIKVIVQFAKKHEKVPMPGYTHMQKAMLSSVGLWAGAFAESLMDDLKVLENAYELNDQCPLGSGASYGIPEQIDREYTAKLLGFSKAQNNVLYCQNSRGKFESVILNSLSQMMLDLAKMCQDIITFSTSEFGYFSLSSEVSTGSSIMPQKRNADVAELVKGNASVMLSYEFLVKNAISGTNSGYVKETQVVKEPTMKGLILAIDTLKVMQIQINGIIVNEKKCIDSCTPGLFAADEAYDLVKKGVSFREAYKQVAQNLDKLKKRDPVAELEKRLKNKSFYLKLPG